VNLFTYKDWMLHLMVISIVLGLVEEWSNIFSLQVWLIWFMVHLVSWSLFIIAVDKELIKMGNDSVKTLFYIGVATVLWFIQHVYGLTNLTSNNFEEGCKRDLLVTTTVVFSGIMTTGVVSTLTALLILT